MDEFSHRSTETTKIYTLSLHDALPIYAATPPYLSIVPHPLQGCETFSYDRCGQVFFPVHFIVEWPYHAPIQGGIAMARSEEHTSELQSQSNLVCRLLLEKKIVRQYCNP